MYNADRRVCRRENFEKRNKAAMRKVLPDQGNYAGTEMTKMAIMAQPIRAEKLRDYSITERTVQAYHETARTPA